MPEIPAARDVDGFPIQAMTGQRLDEIRASYRFSDGSRPWNEDDAMDAFEAVDDLVTEVDRLRAEVERLIGELLKTMGARDGHRRRQIEAERALMLLLIREGGQIEFTPKEIVGAPSDGSFVSSRDAATGNDVLAFVAARRAAREESTS